MHRQRIYIDTSIIGGCLDEEFSEASLTLIKMAVRGEFTLLLSDLLFLELEKVPAEVLKIIEGLPGESVEILTTDQEAESLRSQYMAANVVTKISEDDALHVAIATVNRADLIVSWNFKHIVHVEKIRRFNAVNLTMGYPPIEIRSPREVIYQ